MASGTAASLSAAERRLLATMPLHAITSVHGEAGLRERLLLEVAGFPPADHARAEDALALASRLHCDKREQYRAHVAASLEASPWARVVKAADFTDNAVGLPYTTGPRLPELADKYRPLVPVLRELVLRPDTPLDQAVKDMIAGQLDNAETRLAAITG
jgi:hypothetical protein